VAWGRIEVEGEKPFEGRHFVQRMQVPVPVPVPVVERVEVVMMGWRT